MDTFKILDFQNSLSILSDKGSEIVANCPVCLKAGSLKINKRSQAYETYKCKCTKAIAKALTTPPDKPARQKSTKEWIYQSRDNQPLIKVTRTDNGNGERKFYQKHWNGKTWVSGYGRVDRKQIPIYRYHDIRQAIANGKTIWIVEGEGCADALWGMGLFATCNIGGSGKWLDAHAQDLAGAKQVIICPDRDWKGIEHAQAIAASLTCDIKWLYAMPDSVFWKPQYLPENQGLDVVDWIREGATKEMILSAIEEKPRTFEKSESAKPASKIVPFPSSVQTLAPDEVEQKIDELIERDLSGSKLTSEIAQLAKESGRQPKDIQFQFNQRLKEVESEENSDDLAATVDKILAANNSSIEIGDILPETIAHPIAQHANWLNLRPEVYLTSLITGLSCLHHPETKVILNRAWDFSVTPNLYAAIVAPSSQKKSPVLKAMVSNPLRLLQRKAKGQHTEAISRYQEAILEYESLVKDAKSNKSDIAEYAQTQLQELYQDGRPQEPTEKLYYFTSTSGEGIQYQASRHPNQGMLYEKDELAGVFNSANQYRGGRGSDAEDLLSYYDGTGAQNLRASGVTASAENILLSVLGGIQPAVLKEFLANCEDANGNWARFMFVQQPIAASQMNGDSGKHDLSPVINYLYETTDTLKDQLPKEYTLTSDAFNLFQSAYNRLEILRAAPTTTGSMANVYGKAAGRIGKLAINLHVLWAIATGEEVTPQIPKHIVQKAVKLTHFYIQQIESLYAQMSPEESVPASLAKVIETAKLAGDWIGARDVSNRLSSTDRKRFKATHIRQWFQQLEEMEMGITEGTGRNLKFKFVSKSIQSGYKSGYNANPLQDKDSSLNVSNVSNVSSLSGNKKIEENIPSVDPPAIPEEKDTSGYIGYNGYKPIQTESPQGLANVSTVDTTLDTNSDTSAESINCSRFLVTCREMERGEMTAPMEMNTYLEKFGITQLQIWIGSTDNQQSRDGFDLWSQQRASA